MQKVRQTNVHHFAAGFSNGLVEVAEPTVDVVLFRERFGAVRLAREHGHDLRVRDKAVIRLDVDVGDEAGAKQGDFGSAHRELPPDSEKNGPRGKLTRRRVQLCWFYGNEKPPAGPLPEVELGRRRLLRALINPGADQADLFLGQRGILVALV